MSKLVSEIIRSRIAADAIDDMAADTLTWLIHDALPADAGLDAVDKAITLAREGFSPLFRKPAPKPQAEPHRRVLATIGGVIPMRQPPR